MSSGSSPMYVHAIPETGRLLPSASKWNSIELDFRLLPASSRPLGCTSSSYSKSYEFGLAIADKTHFKRFLYTVAVFVLLVIAAVLLALLVPRKANNLGAAGVLPKNNPIKFRGDSGLKDADPGQNNADLVGGFYDSGNNIKFSFPTAYTVTLLSWSVIEYRQKYSAVGQLDHIMDIIKWGSDYLMKLYIPSGSKFEPALVYSQVGSADNEAKAENDLTCWQRPEDMTYARPVSKCGTSAADLAGEIVAALAAASLVFNQNKVYSDQLLQTANSLFKLVQLDRNHETYTSNKACGGDSRAFYNSTSYLDELAWGSTWLFFATGEFSHLRYATDTFEAAVKEATEFSIWDFNWNNKVAANAMLLTRLRYLHDPGYPYEPTLELASNMAKLIICSYLRPPKWLNMAPLVTPGGLILPSINGTAPLQFAATAAFLTKLYSDYLNLIQVPGESCDTAHFSQQMLHNFASSQVSYILGDNPMKMSYVVGFGARYPKQAHHRGASIPLDGRHYGCSEGKRWLQSKDPNPNVLLGAMVAGPGADDRFFDRRDQPKYTEATISGNAGLVAALIAVLDHPNSSGLLRVNRGMDQEGIFAKIS